MDLLRTELNWTEQTSDAWTPDRTWGSSEQTVFSAPEVSYDFLISISMENQTDFILSQSLMTLNQSDLFGDQTPEEQARQRCVWYEAGVSHKLLQSLLVFGLNFEPYSSWLWLQPCSTNCLFRNTVIYSISKEGSVDPTAGSVRGQSASSYGSGLGTELVSLHATVTNCLMNPQVV